MEYDLKIFERLSKVGAGDVSVEFSGANNRTPSGSSAGSDLNSNGAGGAVDLDIYRFPGASRLDFTIEYLQHFGAYILRDEQFARLFADESPILEKGDALSASMEPLTFQYAQYACNQIGRFADKLYKLQRYHRSEISVFTVSPELVSALRLSYVRAIHQKNPNIDIGVDDNGKPAIRNYLGAIFQKLIGSLDEEIAGLGKDGRDRNPSEDRALCDAVPMGAPPFRELSANESEHSYGYLGYFAATVALAEFAAGNRENAIQLLDKEIKRQIQEQDNPPARGEAKIGVCGHGSPELQASCGKFNRLNAMRRLTGPPEARIPRR